MIKFLSKYELEWIKLLIEIYFLINGLILMIWKGIAIFFYDKKNQEIDENM